MATIYWIILVVTCVTGFHLANGQGDIPFKTKVVCYQDGLNNKHTVQNFICQTTELIFINKAYDGKSLSWSPRYCEDPTTEPDYDCKKSEYQRTYELLLECGLKSYCNRYPPYRSVSNCGDEFGGDPYLAVEYACYSKYNNGTDIYYHYAQFDINRDDFRLGNRALIYTDKYPQWQNAQEYSGACQVTLPENGYLVVHLMDFRGRLIQSVDGCPIYLTLHDGTHHYHLCGERDWSYQRFVLKPISSPWRVDLIISTDTENSEGRIQLLIEGLTSDDQYVESMSMVCGQNVQDLYTVPTTTSTSTTTTTTSTTTTTTPTTTTTTTPTTTTTTTPTTTTTTTPTTTTTTKPTTTTTTTTPRPPTPAPAPGPTTTKGSTTTGDNNTKDPGSSTKINGSVIIVGAAVGGIVLVVIIILAVVICCTRKKKKKKTKEPFSRKRAQSVSSNDMIFAFDGQSQNGHLSDPRNHNGCKKKHPETETNDRHYNAYITSNLTQKPSKKGKGKKSMPSPSASRTPDEFYAEIDDGSAATNTWMVDNKNLNVNSPAHYNTQGSVVHDPSFEEPTERTLKLAKGTTRGFNY